MKQSRMKLARLASKTPAWVVPVVFLAGCNSADRAEAETGALPAEAITHFQTVVDDLDEFWHRLIPDYRAPTVVSYRRGQVPETVCSEGTDVASWAGTASYCFDDEILAYEEDFLASVWETANPHAATTILAHEWGHHLQQLRGVPDFALQRELGADCYAGFFLTGRYGGPSEIDEALASMERLAHAGNLQYAQSAWFDEAEHGSPAQRSVAFTAGGVTGAFAEGDLRMCDGYHDYKPDAPVVLGAYTLAHLPGFDHDRLGSGVVVRRDDVEMWLEPLEANELPQISASPDEFVRVVWDDYLHSQEWTLLGASVDAPTVSARPHGEFVALNYVADDEGLIRAGTFRVHRAVTGEALIVDSWSTASHTDIERQQTEGVGDSIFAQTLGAYIEQFLCVPGQSRDLESPDYFFSCDLEHEP